MVLESFALQRSLVKGSVKVHNKPYSSCCAFRHPLEGRFAWRFILNERNLELHQKTGLTHLRLASQKRDIRKQCRSRSDAAECRMRRLIRIYFVCINTGISIKHGNNKNQPDAISGQTKTLNFPLNSAGC